MHAPIERSKTTPRMGIVTLLVLLSMRSPGIPAEIPENAPSHVGMSSRIDQIVLPGPKLKAKPLEERRRPLVVRIAQSFPHGANFRYDLVYYGLEPGEYDLRDYLQREDGSPAGDLPPLKVTVLSSLPPGQIEPNAPEAGVLPALGGYRAVLVIAGAFWVAGLASILLLGHKVSVVNATLARPSLSLDEELHRTIETILSGRFTESDKSRLERLLLGVWRRHLGLENAEPDKAMAAMRAHPGAAHLLDQLERWLHQPATREPIDVAALLRPYQKTIEQRQHERQRRGRPETQRTSEGAAR